MSSHDYWLQGWFPFADPEEETVAQAGRVLGVPVVRQDWGPEVAVDRLSVSTLLPDGAGTVAETAEWLGFEINASVNFEDSSHSDPEMAGRIAQNVVRIAASFATWSQVHAVLLEENSPGHIVLAVRNGQVTLNQDWEGWTSWPEVLSAVPQPYELRSIQLR